MRRAPWGRDAISFARPSASSRARARAHQAVGEAHAQGFGAGYAATGEDEIESVAVADQPGQPDGAAVHQRDAPAPAVDAEHRVLGRHAQVAPGGELEPARHGVSLDGRDRRLAEQHARGADRAVAVGRQARGARSARLAHGLQIGAGAERAVRPDEHRDVEGVVAVEAAEGVRELRRRRPVDGVGDLGAVEGHDRQVPPGFEVDGHGATPCEPSSLRDRCARRPRPASTAPRSRARVQAAASG